MKAYSVSVVWYIETYSETHRKWFKNSHEVDYEEYAYDDLRFMRESYPNQKHRLVRVTTDLMTVE